MGLDLLSFAAPARIQILLVPAGSIRRSRFESFADRLRSERLVRLGNVSPSSKANSNLFSPLAFPEGIIIYDLQLAPPPHAHLSLTPFELYRQPLLVLGLFDWVEDEDEFSADEDGSRTGSHGRLSGYLENLEVTYPHALLHQMLVFEHGGTEQSLPDGVFSVPSPAKSRTTTIKTLMCDLTSRLLAEMAGFAKVIQAATSIGTPSITAMPNSSNEVLSALPPHMVDSLRPKSNTERPKSSWSIADDMKWRNRMSLPVNASSHKISLSGNPESRPISPAPGARSPQMIPDEDTTVSSNLSSRVQSRERSRAGSQDRSIHHYESSDFAEREKIKFKGRASVILGSMYLLAGRWSDALRELVQGTNAARANSDYVWQAKALDYLLTCLLICAWARMDFHVPEVLRPSSERPVSSSSKNKNPKTSSEFNLSRNVESDRRLSNLRDLADLLPVMLNNILNLYSRAWTFTEDKIPPLSYCHSILRFTKILTTLSENNGLLEERELEQIVLNAPSYQEDQQLKYSRSSHSAMELSALLLRAYPSSWVEGFLSIDDQIIILASIASTLSKLGYHRKKALVLKDLLSRLLPSLAQARKQGAAEMGVHPAASLASLAGASEMTGDERFIFEQDASEQMIDRLLAYVCESYGVRDNARYQSKAFADSPQSSMTKSDSIEQENALSIWMAIDHFLAARNGFLDLRITVLRSCINICEALPNLAGALKYSALLLKTAGSGIAPGLDSNNGSPSISVDEQVRLANNISRTLNAAQRIGLQHLEAEYWDEFLVRGIELVETGSLRALFRHVKSELEIVKTIELEKEKNPFIYNPFLKTKQVSEKESLVVAGEGTAFQVTLQNLYDFDLCIEQIKLEADNTSFMSNSSSIIIGPYRTQAVLLTGSTLKAGPLVITGCYAKIRGCRERRFAIFTEPWESNFDKRWRKYNTDLGGNQRRETVSEIVKASSLATRLGPKTSSLSLEVITAQPVLDVVSMSIPQSAVMLLEGEKRIISILLRNVSSQIAANLVLLSFKDSTASQVLPNPTSDDSSEIELYELELAVSSKPSFRWRRDLYRSTTESSKIFIAAGEEASLHVEVLGKPGLSTGTIQVDYAYLKDTEGKNHDTFYTRQLSIPIAVTVNASIDLIRSDVVSFNANMSWQASHFGVDFPKAINLRPASVSDKTASMPDSLPKSTVSQAAKKPYVLLILDFRNCWPKTLIIHLTLSDDGIDDELNSMNRFDKGERLPGTTTSHAIAPGAVSRIPIPIPKILLSPSQIQAPIPILNPATARQFVVSKNRKSLTEEIRMRETFWYREELLKRIAVRWEEQETGRVGQVEMRALQLNSRMLAALKLEDVDIAMNVITAEENITAEAATAPHENSDDGTGRERRHSSNASSAISPSEIQQTAHQAFHVPTCTFLSLRATLFNRCPVPLQGILRLQPTLAGQPHHIALDLGKKLLVNGLLQRRLPLLEPGKEVSVDTEFVVLSQGVYEWGACIDEIKSDDGLNAAIVEGKDRNGTESGGGARPRARTGVIDISEAVERRTWYADGPCKIIARDA